MINVGSIIKLVVREVLTHGVLADSPQGITLVPITDVQRQLKSLSDDN